MRPEQMRVYQLCEELEAEIDRILAGLPYNVRKIADHLERSMNSAGLNLSEGLTVYKPLVKASAFDVSRKETGEVRKALRRLLRKKAITPQQYYKPDNLANCFIGALTNMIKQQEERARNGD
jgi:four helix bundle protein